MGTKNLALRILYTINSSPQYILARSSSLIPASIITHVQRNPHYDRTLNQATQDGPGMEPQYATVSLKMCLDTICRSSPELVQDFSRDFSVYVLDPLESNSAPAPVNISNNSSIASQATVAPVEQTRGVAVGLGLMSWALLADESDSVAVTGTLINFGTSREAVEVIFALRETAAMQKASLPAALRSWGLPPQPTSKLSRIHASKSHRESKHPAKPLSPSSLSTQPNTSWAAPLRRHQPSEDTRNIQRRNSCDSSSSATSSVHRSVNNVAETSSSASTPSPPSIVDLPVPQADSMRPLAKPTKLRKIVNSASICTSEADRLMLAEEVYIGPVKKKGRPSKTLDMMDSETHPDSHNAIASGSRSTDSAEDAITVNLEGDINTVSQHLTRNHEKEISMSQASESEPTPDTAKVKPNVKKRARHEIPSPFATSPLIRDLNTPSPTKPSEPVTLLDILACLSASAPTNDPNVQNAALLAALNAIDSNTSSAAPGKATNPALVNALRDLLSATSKQSPLPIPPHIPDTRTFSGHHRPQPQDDEIVLLDKENVNPSAFRRRAERDSVEAKLSGGSSPPQLESLDRRAEGRSSSPAPLEPTSHNRGLTTRANGNTTPTTKSLPIESTASGLRRKRTLSDFMDERESGMKKGKSKERERAERRDAHRHAQSPFRRNSSSDASTSEMRHYPRLGLDSLQRERSGMNSYYRTGMEPWTSPPRPAKNARSLANQNIGRIHMEGNPTKTSNTHQTAYFSASSPIRPSIQSQVRRRYVVPEWARTKTSTQPRLSLEAQRALEEAKERKKEEKEGKKKAVHRGDKLKRNARSMSPSQRIKFDNAVTYPREPIVWNPSSTPQPIAASTDCPVFSVASTSQSTLSPGHNSSPKSRSSPPPPIDSAPSTPPRTCPRNRHSSGNNSSLFTPTPNFHRIGAAGSPLCSPQGTPTLLLTKRSKGIMSPIQAIAMGRGIPRALGWGNASNESDDEGDRTYENLDDALNRELSSALGELEPSRSLPAATNADIDTGKGATSSQLSDEQIRTPKQHWVGLPPSSPPPPTSPISMPLDIESEPSCETDDDPNEWEPPVTSDVEDHSLDSEAMPDLSTYTDEELAAYLSNNNDFCLSLPDADSPTLVDSVTNPDMDVFEQFTNLNAQSDDQSVTETMDMNVDGGFDFFHNGLADFDFTEFWETFKPLVHDHTKNSNNSLSSVGFEEEDGNASSAMHIDHAKLADDVQALFSGCLM